MDRAQTHPPRPQDLADHSNRLLHAVEELRELEQRKRRETISTPPFHHLADDVKAKSREIFRIADDQEALGDRIPTQSDLSIDALDEDDPQDEGRT